MQITITEAWLFPINYNILGVRKTYWSLTYSKGDNYEKLTWLSEATPNAFIIHIKISIFPCTRAVFDPDNNLETLRRPFGEIIKFEIALTGLKGKIPLEYAVPSSVQRRGRKDLLAGPIL